MRKYSTAVLILIAAAAWISSGAALQMDQIITTIEHSFGESVRFQAEIESENPGCFGCYLFPGRKGHSNEYGPG